MSELESNKALAATYLERIAAGDADGVADMFVDDGAIIVQSTTLLPPEVRGKDNIRNLIGGLPPLFPETGLRVIPDLMTAEADRVSVIAHSDAVHVSGKPYRNRYHFLLTFRDGKIFESHEYLDSLLLTNIFFGGQQPG